MDGLTLAGGWMPSGVRVAPGRPRLCVPARTCQLRTPTPNLVGFRHAQGGEFVPRQLPAQGRVIVISYFMQGGGHPVAGVCLSAAITNPGRERKRVREF